MAKYRRIFLEEATDHLGEISHALLDLEKEMGSAESIDTVFRMAHSIKSMAASLGYDSVAELSHAMEDLMEGVRAAGRVRGHDELRLLFRGLESLEAMVAAVSNEEDLPDAPPDLLEALANSQAAELGSEDASAEVAPAPPPAAVDPANSEAATPDRVGGEPKKVRS